MFGEVAMRKILKRSSRPWLALATLLAALAAYAPIAQRAASMRMAARLDRVEAGADRLADDSIAPESTVSLRVEHLGPLLASWETVGGCGAGGTGGGGVGVKWIGHNTTGGLFNAQVMSNYVTTPDGYNLTTFAQISRDLDQGQKWNVGVIVPYLYKYYRNYLQLPVDISNGGLGDINVLLTRRLGPINATSVTAGLGLPTGIHDAQYRHEYLTQDKQLGLGNFTGFAMLDHTMDQTWGLIVLGGVAAYRGGRNDLQSYRAPSGSLYAYTGYFLGPFVPAIGASFTGFLSKDQDRTLDQDVPLSVVSGSASIEWSNEDIAILAGVNLPFSFGDFVLQPWMVALGVCVSPF
jgi:hypothetical protein